MILALLLPITTNFLPQKQTIQTDPKLLQEYIKSQNEIDSNEEKEIKIPDIEGTYQVVDIPSGNTVTVMWGNDKKDIKLIGFKEISGTKETLEKKLKNSFIHLEFDNYYPKEDNEGRFSAYAYDENGIFINYDLLLHGDAIIESELPETIKYITEFKDAQNSAKANQYGFWAENSEQEAIK